MTPVGVIAIVLCIPAIGFAWTRVTIYRLMMSLVVLLVHTVACIYYYKYSITALADASSYYYDPLHWSSLPWGLSTIFVIKVCNLLKVYFGASYVDCFLIFQWFGFAGLMVMARVFEEIETNIVVPERRGYWFLLLLPSVNFWTAAIGKDAPVFFAIAVCTWAMLSLRKRFVFFCFALGIMLLLRAHVALMAFIALSGAAFFGTSISFGRKAGLFALALVGFWFASGVVESSLGVNAASISDVSDYLGKENAVFATVSGTTSVGDIPFPAKVLSLLFRPLFLDAHGLLGVVASLENVGVIIAFLYMLVHWRDLAQLVRHVLFIRFAVLFALITIILLSLVYYNAGLGLRQRVMAYPAVYAVLVALWSVRQKRGLASAPRVGGGLMVNANPNRTLMEQ